MVHRIYLTIATRSHEFGTSPEDTVTTVGRTSLVVLCLTSTLSKRTTGGARVTTWAIARAGILDRLYRFRGLALVGGI